MVEQANEWRIPIFVMDYDVAAAFDHVSHHVIIDAMKAMKVPPVLVAAWIRECRGSETFIKLDDIMTPGIKTHALCTARRRLRGGSFRAALDTPAAAFCEKCQVEEWRLPVNGGYLGLPLFADSCWIVAMSAAELPRMARAWNELLKKAGLRIARPEAVPFGRK